MCVAGRPCALASWFPVGYLASSWFRPDLFGSYYCALVLFVYCGRLLLLLKDGGRSGWTDAVIVTH